LFVCLLNQSHTQQKNQQTQQKNTKNTAKNTTKNTTKTSDLTRVPHALGTNGVHYKVRPGRITGAGHFGRAKRPKFVKNTRGQFCVKKTQTKQVI
jgi:hypothetical protein